MEDDIKIIIMKVNFSIPAHGLGWNSGAGIKFSRVHIDCLQLMLCFAKRLS